MALDHKKIRFLRNLLWPFLFPISLLWAAVAPLRVKLYSRYLRPYRSKVPVFCVGNLHTGGSGKTPIVAAIAEHFRPFRPVILSRGYGRKHFGAAAPVDPKIQDATSAFGDEPVWLAEKTGVPVWVDSNRARGAKQIEALHEAGFILLDDGFQHVQLHRDLDLVALRVNRKQDESFCLPLGDLREPVSGLSRASAVLLVYFENERELLGRWSEYLSARFPKVRQFPILRKSALDTQLSAGSKIGAFCGIADPEPFFSQLPVEAAVRKHFGDHHCYGRRDAESLKRDAVRLGLAAWVTTEKDRVKLRDFESDIGARLVTVGLAHEFPDDFWYFLEQRLQPA